MIISPIQQILNLLSSLFSVALIALEIYLFRKWYEGGENAEWYLYSGIFSVFITLLGRSLVLFFCKKSDTDEPKDMHSSETEKMISLEDSSEINLEYFGPKDAEQTLILIHGSGVDSRQWYYLKKSLQENYRLILLDLAGYGLSDKPKNGDYSLKRYAGDLKQIIDGCTKPPILIGHSMGTMIILTYCQRFFAESQTKIKSLVLLNPTYTNPLKTTIFSSFFQILEKPLIIPLSYLQIIFSPLMQLSNYLSYINGSLHLAVLITGFAGTQTDRQLDFATQFGLTNSVKTVAKNLLDMLKYDVSDVLSQLTIPVKVLTATKDKVIKPEASTFIAEQIPNSSLKVVEKAGHMVMLEKTEVFGQEFINFLEK